MSGTLVPIKICKSWVSLGNGYRENFRYGTWIPWKFRKMGTSQKKNLGADGYRVPARKFFADPWSDSNPEIESLSDFQDLRNSLNGK